MERTGACKFCGQVILVDTDKEATQEEVDGLAILQCNCNEAIACRAKERKRLKAETFIQDLFNSDGDDTVELLKVAAAYMAKGDTQKVTITTADGIKATLLNKEKSIKVERTEILKNTLEG